MSLHWQGEAVDSTLPQRAWWLWSRPRRADRPDLRHMDPYDYGAVGYQAHVQWGLAYIRRTYGLPTPRVWRVKAGVALDEADFLPTPAPEWAGWNSIATAEQAEATARRLLEQHLTTQQTTRLRTVVNPGVHTLTAEDIKRSGEGA